MLGIYDDFYDYNFVNGENVDIFRVLILNYINPLYV